MTNEQIAVILEKSIKRARNRSTSYEAWKDLESQTLLFIDVLRNGTSDTPKEA